MCVCVSTVFRRIRELCDRAMYPTSLELLRVNLAATIFRPAVRDLLKEFKDDVSAVFGITDLDPLETYLSHFWELLQLNNSVRACNSFYLLLGLLFVILLLSIFTDYIY